MLRLAEAHAPVSVNVALPVGLLVNELLTNAFKYAFVGRDGDALMLECLSVEEGRCRVVMAVPLARAGISRPS